MSNKDILEVIRMKKEQRDRKSELGKKHFENKIAKNAEEVKSIVSGENVNNGVPVEVISIRNEYYRRLERYTGKRSIFNTKMNKRSISLWTRVEQARKKVGCSYSHFMAAQFDWFNRTFGKAPSPEQLATEAAVDRVFIFSGSNNTVHVGNNKSFNVSDVDIFKQSEKFLQSVLRAQKCTRVEFYKKFIIPGIYSLPKKFLNADPVYRKVLKELSE